MQENIEVGFPIISLQNIRVLPPPRFQRAAMDLFILREKDAFQSD
jgi:hypothetical protein